MSAVLSILRAGPLTSIQDDGRFGMLRHGISASGPMDRGAFQWAGALAGGGQGGIEFTAAGLELKLTSMSDARPETVTKTVIPSPSVRATRLKARVL